MSSNNSNESSNDSLKRASIGACPQMTSNDFPQMISSNDSCVSSYDSSNDSCPQMTHSNLDVGFGSVPPGWDSKASMLPTAIPHDCAFAGGVAREGVRGRTALACRRAVPPDRANGSSEGRPALRTAADGTRCRVRRWCLYCERIALVRTRQSASFLEQVDPLVVVRHTGVLGC